jgi:hypothetical protein
MESGMSNEELGIPAQPAAIKGRCRPDIPNSYFLIPYLGVCGGES